MFWYRSKQNCWLSIQTILYNSPGTFLAYFTGMVRMTEAARFALTLGVLSPGTLAHHFLVFINNRKQVLIRAEFQLTLGPTGSDQQDQVRQSYLDDNGGTWSIASAHWRAPCMSRGHTLHTCPSSPPQCRGSSHVHLQQTHIPDLTQSEARYPPGRKAPCSYRLHSSNSRCCCWGTPGGLCRGRTDPSWSLWSRHRWLGTVSQVGENTTIWRKPYERTQVFKMYQV